MDDSGGGNSVVTDIKTNIEAQCVVKGMRMTEQRRVIARVLSGSADHPDVEELYRRCAEIDHNISISTVYRTVNFSKTPASSSAMTSARAAPATSRCVTSTTTT